MSDSFDQFVMEDGKFVLELVIKVGNTERATGFFQKTLEYQEEDQEEEEEERSSKQREDIVCLIHSLFFSSGCLKWVVMPTRHPISTSLFLSLAYRINATVVWNCSRSAPTEAVEQVEKMIEDAFAQATGAPARQNFHFLNVENVPDDMVCLDDAMEKRAMEEFDKWAHRYVIFAWIRVRIMNGAVLVKKSHKVAAVSIGA